MQIKLLGSCLETKSRVREKKYLSKSPSANTEAFFILLDFHLHMYHHTRNAWVGFF
jgi:hypothetical protein